MDDSSWLKPNRYKSASPGEKYFCFLSINTWHLIYLKQADVIQIQGCKIKNGLVCSFKQRRKKFSGKSLVQQNQHPYNESKCQ